HESDARPYRVRADPPAWRSGMFPPMAFWSGPVEFVPNALNGRSLNMSGQSVTSKNSCFCHHCKKDGFNRRDLNRWFLCKECAEMPGVQGYHKVSERGLDSGAPDYWNKTRSQLHVVDDGVPETKLPRQESE